MNSTCPSRYRLLVPPGTWLKSSGFESTLSYSTAIVSGLGRRGPVVDVGDQDALDTPFEARHGHVAADRAMVAVCAGFPDRVPTA